MSILLKGVMASTCPINLKPFNAAIFVSPSIEYSAHPRYSAVWKYNDKYMQLVLQLRVQRGLLMQKKEGTIEGAFERDPQMGSNVQNSELEWVIEKGIRSFSKAEQGILVYGIMMRVSDVHPGKLSQNKWWELSRDPNRKNGQLWDYF